MSRSVEPDGREFCERTPPEAGLDRPGRELTRDHPAERGHVDRVQLRAAIDRAAEGHPTYSEFVQRLEAARIRAVPSLQKSGRLNGMSYDVPGQRIKGSELGRAYTALGLQKHKGLRHDGEPDHTSLERAAREAVQRPVERNGPERAYPDLRDRADRLRLYEALSANERAALRDIGRFRTVQLQDVIPVRYRGDRAAWRRDYERLAREKLIEQRSIVVATHARRDGRHRARTVRSLW